MEAAARRAPEPSPPLTPAEQLRAGREILRLEAIALWKFSDRLDESFVRTVDLIYRSSGSVIVTGMGKAGLIGQKITATLASVGTRAHFLHPAEAFHGDLGRIHRDDIVLMLTQSGETSEVVQLLPSLAEFGVPIVAVTASQTSTVGRAATEVLQLGDLEEACSLGLAPSTSTTAMLALGDALALVLSRLRGFGPEDFARFHPGGSLGRKLSKVDEHMRPLAMCRVSRDGQTIREVLVECGKPGRRTGAVMLTDNEGVLTGLFTDSDLARLFERRDEAVLDQAVRRVMIAEPITIAAGSLLRDAVDLLVDRKISELPVVDDAGRPVGLIDVTDVVGIEVLDHTETKTAKSAKSAKPQGAGPPTVRLFTLDDPRAADEWDDLDESSICGLA
jgi:arabinose-5-phosphate isomerase